MRESGASVSRHLASDGSLVDEGGSGLSSADAAVVVGGDGTMHHLAGALKEHGVPVYHVPVGTENLFARQFGMTSREGSVLDALRGRRVTLTDLGLCNGKPFLLMCSLGFDANVVRRVARNRRGAISRLDYVAAALHEAWRPEHPTMTVEIDGERVVEDRKGLLVVANSREYGGRLDPASRASIADGLLDVVFLPAESRARLALWTLRLFARQHLGHRDIVYGRARRVRVETERPHPYQVDGESSTDETDLSRAEPGSITPLEIGVVPGSFPVLTPVGWREPTRPDIREIGAVRGGLGIRPERAV